MRLVLHRFHAADIQDGQMLVMRVKQIKMITCYTN